MVDAASKDINTNETKWVQVALQLAGCGYSGLVSGWWVGWHLQWVHQCPQCQDYSGVQ